MRSTREQGLRQLDAFVPSAGRAYAARRNYDDGPGRHTSVSCLAPFIRHRLITEAEVVAAVLRQHSPATAEKFIQEVCWRTYWKGWLEQRPQVWTAYLSELEQRRQEFDGDRALADALNGSTGIQCFDAWVHELVDTGYLHNHARMWFASIWIFTLRLPWVLGADFFLRHLLDGDPASNTLSWRWVAGLHTRGKTYLARRDNIATYTGGRFAPVRDELAAYADPLNADPLSERIALRPADRLPDGTAAVLLLTHEDLAPETWPLEGLDVRGVAVLGTGQHDDRFAPAVRHFKASALVDAADRSSAHWKKPVVSVDSAGDLATFARDHGAASVVTTCVPVGFTRSRLEPWIAECAAVGVPVCQILRPWDALFWPHAKAGFFQLKDRIPAVIETLGLVTQRRLL